MLKYFEYTYRYPLLHVTSKYKTCSTRIRFVLNRTIATKKKERLYVWAHNFLSFGQILKIQNSSRIFSLKCAYYHLPRYEGSVPICISRDKRVKTMTNIIITVTDVTYTSFAFKFPSNKVIKH